MDTTHIPTLVQMADYVSGSTAVRLCCLDKKEAYNYIERVAVAHEYLQLRKRDKGTVRGYLRAVTGYSDAQLTRLLSQYRAKGHIAAAKRTQPTFKGIYTAADIAELARIDDLFEGLSGPATVNILKRECSLFGNPACERLQHLSVAQLYRFRGSTSYRRIRMQYTKTKPAGIPIGERTKPRPDGRPGFLRVDSVHQEDKDGEKGVYHVNLVDEITQWEVVVCVQGISELFMLPALEAALELFPFVVLNFHADNGSEYINQKVAKLLQLMLVKSNEKPTTP